MDTYIRLLFIDFSFVFNTILPSKLILKLIMDFTYGEATIIGLLLLGKNAYFALFYPFLICRRPLMWYNNLFLV